MELEKLAESDLRFMKEITRIGGKFYGYVGRNDVNGVTYSVQELTEEEVQRFDERDNKN